MFRSVATTGISLAQLENGRAQVHIGRMTDEWNEQLRCPECRRTGMASLSQADSDDTPTVHSVPDGFKVVMTEYGPDFVCATCDVAAAP
jgi:hypothetical protein